MYNSYITYLNIGLNVNVMSNNANFPLFLHNTSLTVFIITFAFTVRISVLDYLISLIHEVSYYPVLTSVVSYLLVGVCLAMGIALFLKGIAATKAL